MSMQKEAVENYVKEHLDKALKMASSILQKEISQASFNGIIGGKNKTYDVDALNYDTPEEYIEAWKQSHEVHLERDLTAPYEKSSDRIYYLLQDAFMEKFIENYLARTYFRKHA